MHLNRPIATAPMVSVCPRWADPRHSRWGCGYLPVEGRFMQPNLKWTDDAIIQHLRDVSCGKPFIKTTDVTNYLRKTIIRRFGSFTSACEQAGVIPYKGIAGISCNVKCAVEDCCSPVRSSHSVYCEKHYMRMRRKGRLNRDKLIQSDMNIHAFDVLNDATAWVLGLIWSDGCLSWNRVSITSKDFDLLNTVEQVVGGRDLIKRRKIAKYGNLSMLSSYLANVLRQYGLTEAKSLICRWPIGMPRDLDWAFLRGVIDGDGTVRLTPKRTVDGRNMPVLHVSVVSGSSGFVADIKELLDSVNIRYSVSWKTSVNCFIGKITIHRIDSLRLLYSLMHGSNGPSLERKRRPFEEWMAIPRVKTTAPNYCRGSRVTCSKMTEETVVKARRKHDVDGASIRHLARAYGLSQSTMSAIIRKKSWVHV